MMEKIYLRILVKFLFDKYNPSDKRYSLDQLEQFENLKSIVEVDTDLESVSQYCFLDNVDLKVSNDDRKSFRSSLPEAFKFIGE